MGSAKIIFKIQNYRIKNRYLCVVCAYKAEYFENVNCSKINFKIFNIFSLWRCVSFNSIYFSGKSSSTQQQVEVFYASIIRSPYWNLGEYIYTSLISRAAINWWFSFSRNKGLISFYKLTHAISNGIRVRECFLIRAVNY